MYQETKEKAKELKDHYREDYTHFRDSSPVTRMFKQYEHSLQSFFEQYSRFDQPVQDASGVSTMSNQAFLKMSQKT